MSKGELDNAVRRALNLFDAWNNVTGVVEPHTGYYYEIQAVITDAVHCGAQAGTSNYKMLDSEEECPEIRSKRKLNEHRESRRSDTFRWGKRPA